MPAPELPDWCLEEEEGHSDNEEQNGDALEDGSRPDGSRKKFRRDPRLKVSHSCCYLSLLESWGLGMIKRWLWRPLT